jgi:hypothetical protein
MAIGIVGSNNGYSRTASDNRFLKLSGGTVNGNLAINSGNISTSQPLTLTQTWTTSATYTGLQVNVTDSGPSNAASLLMDLQVGGVSRASVRKNGRIFATNPGYNQPAFSFASFGGGLGTNGTNAYIILTASEHAIGVTSAGALMIGLNADALIFRDAANTLAQRNGVAAQTFRLYNTYTSATSFERLDFRWDSNVAKIGTQKGATSGVARDLALETDGTTRMTITSAGNVGIGTATPTTKLEITTAVAGDGIKLNRSDGERVAWLVDEGSGSGALYMFNGSNSNSVFITGNGNSFLNGGNVGIGTSSPSAGKLVVDGNIAFNNFGQRLIFDGSATHGYVDTFAAGGARRARIYGYAGVTLASNLVSQGLTMVENGNVGIGTTTPTAKLDILDTTLAGSGSLSGSALNIDQTWNTTGTPTAIKLNVTDTGGTSNAASLLADFQVGGVSRFSVDKSGVTRIRGTLPTLRFGGGSNPFFYAGGNELNFRGSQLVLQGVDATPPGSLSFFRFDSSPALFGEASGTIAQRNGVNPQESRIYGTYTDGSNYRRLALKMSTAGVAQIVAEGAGTGAADNILEITSPLHLNLNSNSNGKITLRSNGNTGILLQSTGAGTSILTSNAATSSFGNILSIARTGAGTINFQTRAVTDTNYENKLVSSGSYTKKFIIEASSVAGGVDGCDVIVKSGSNAGSPTSRCGDLYLAPTNTAGSGRNGNLILLHDGTTSSNGNVGIGTTSPASKLTVTGGDIEVTDSASGIILKSPNGTRWRIIIDDSGELTTTAL